MKDEEYLKSRDGELVQRTREGDKEAYGELVTSYQGHVYGLAYSLVGDWANAQDIAQEAFIRAYSNIEQLRDPSRFAAWLRRVTFSVAMNWLKAFRPRVFEQLDGRVDLDSLDIPDFAPGPREVMEKRELAEAVLGAVNSLPPKYRVPLTMFHLDGLSYEKVASFLDIPLGTAKSLIHRARKKLKEALAAYAAEEVTPMVQEVLNEHRLPEEFAAKVLEGVKGWSMGEKESSIHAAQAAVMEAIGEDVDYEYLVGVSGLAFRMQVSKEGLCPSSGHPFCGFQCVAGSNNALPRHLRIFEVKPDDAEGVREARQAVVDSIERGVPAQYGSEEDGVIVGYQKKGEEWVCTHPLRDGGQETFVETKWPWGIVVFTERKESVPGRRELALAALRQAVAMAKTAEAENYYVGFKAWDMWIERLKALDEADEQTRKDAMLGNSWIYECLAQYRAVAARYLEQVADEFNPTAAAHLKKASELYAQMSAGSLRGDKCLLDVAPLPWSLKEGEAWTKEMRHDQIKRLEAALPLEREAIQEIEKALASVE